MEQNEGLKHISQMDTKTYDMLVSACDFIARYDGGGLDIQTVAAQATVRLVAHTFAAPAGWIALVVVELRAANYARDPRNLHALERHSTEYLTHLMHRAEKHIVENPDEVSTRMDTQHALVKTISAILEMRDAPPLHPPALVVDGIDAAAKALVAGAGNKPDAKATALRLAREHNYPVHINCGGEVCDHYCHKCDRRVIENEVVRPPQGQPPNAPITARDPLDYPTPAYQELEALTSPKVAASRLAKRLGISIHVGCGGAVSGNHCARCDRQVPSPDVVGPRDAVGADDE